MVAKLLTGINASLLIGIIVFIFSHLDEVVAIHWFLNNHDQIKQSVSTYNDVIDLNVRQSQMKVKVDSIEKKVNVALKNKAPYDSLILSRNGRTRHIHHKTPWVYR
jgi:hypothetical protein